MIARIEVMSVVVRTMSNGFIVNAPSWSGRGANHKPSLDGPLRGAGRALTYAPTRLVLGTGGVSRLGICDWRKLSYTSYWQCTTIA